MTDRSTYSAHPAARILAGGVLLAGCLLADHRSTAALLVLPALAVAGMLMSRARATDTLKLILAGGIFYAPMLLFASPGIAVKGLSATVVGLATVSSLGTQALHDGVLHLPLPASVRLLILQIVHQSEVLRKETIRMHQAITVRGGVHGVRGMWEFAKALPVSWLPRVVHRAERVGRAMDMREYGVILPDPPAVRWRKRDMLLIAGALGIAVAAVWFSTAAGVR